MTLQYLIYYLMLEYDSGFSAEAGQTATGKGSRVVKGGGLTSSSCSSSAVVVSPGPSFSTTLGDEAVAVEVASVFPALAFHTSSTSVADNPAIALTLLYL